MSLLPRGMRDYLPEETERFERIRDEFRATCRLYGFKMMEPSPLEMLSTLEAKSGPSVRDEIYHFRDRGGREVGLRFDLTVGLTRIAASDRAAPLPIKLASFAGVFRYDEPQHARYRWFYQWDTEIYGSPNLEADAEIIEFTARLLSRCGLKDYVIKVGDRAVVQEFIQKHTGRGEDESIELMRALDKVDKKPAEQLVGEYTEKGFKVDEIQQVLSFGKLEGRSEDVLKDLKDFGLKSSSRLEQLTSLLDALKVKHQVSMRIVRGIDYYTSIVFEAFDSSRLDLGAIAGGGRFDNLAKIFGRDDLPATGVAGGVDRLMLALQKGGEEGSGLQVYVAYAGEMVKEALSVANSLRDNQLSVQVDLQRRSLSKQLESAAKSKARYAVMILPREYSENLVVVRSMSDGKEQRVNLAELHEYLARD
ncbi:MAG: histidine--tRNA ligase [Conexivisphaerales archaeon]